MKNVGDNPPASKFRPPASIIEPQFAFIDSCAENRHQTVVRARVEAVKVTPKLCIAPRIALVEVAKAIH